MKKLQGTLVAPAASVMARTIIAPVQVNEIQVISEGMIKAYIILSPCENACLDENYRHNSTSKGDFNIAQSRYGPENSGMSHVVRQGAGRLTFTVFVWPTMWLGSYKFDLHLPKSTHKLTNLLRTIHFEQVFPFAVLSRLACRPSL